MLHIWADYQAQAFRYLPAKDLCLSQMTALHLGWLLPPPAAAWCPSGRLESDSFCSRMQQRLLTNAAVAVAAMTVSPRPWALKVKSPKFQTGNCKEQFQGQTPLGSRSLLQEERRQTGNFPWSQRLTEKGSATLWSQLRLCRLPTGTPPERKGRERKPRTRRGLGANPTQKQRKDCHGDAATHHWEPS